MALATSARRDQRRRLVASWNRSASTEAASDNNPPAPGRVAAYDDAARPERHPGFATRLPTTLGGLVGMTLLILGGVGGAIAFAVSGPIFGRPLLEGGGRFAGSLAVVRRTVEAGVSLPLHTWLAVLSLFAAAAAAGSIKYMRRHRRDDYKGRFRAWGWLATIFSVAAWSGIVPIGSLVAVFMSEATGMTLGPGGLGWWYAMTGLAFVVVLPWAVLPLRQRAGTSFWMTLGMLAWAGAVVATWAPAWIGVAERAALVSSVAWSAGAAFLLVAMLTAARGVIREVRGEVAAAPSPKVRKESKAREPKKQEVADEEGDDETDEAADEPSSWNDATSESESDDAGQTDFTDGSFGNDRRLSKAERKRLKKLARMNGHAA
jgi:hypothetical protein